MTNVTSIAVYCASSAKVDPSYLAAAKELGEILAKEKIHCIYGAGHIGLMGAMADAILKAKGKITGIIPAFMVDQNWHHKGLEELIVTEGMHERKSKMAQLSDAAVTLPGGCGTLEELMEVITWKQLSLYPKPIIIINTNGYFDPLIQMLEKAVDEKFMRPEHTSLWKVVNSPSEVLTAIKNMPPNIQNDYSNAVV